MCRCCWHVDTRKVEQGERTGRGKGQVAGWIVQGILPKKGMLEQRHDLTQVFQNSLAIFKNMSSPHEGGRDRPDLRPVPPSTKLTCSRQMSLA